MDIVQRPGTCVVPRNSDEDDLLDMLNMMPLKQLSAYVKSQVEELNATYTNLERRRSQGTHKISIKTQNFVFEFDRFLTAYSDIVNIITLVDGQQGGVACATLALLFSVRYFLQINVDDGLHSLDSEGEDQRRGGDHLCNAADL